MTQKVKVGTRSLLKDSTQSNTPFFIEKKVRVSRSDKSRMEIYTLIIKKNTALIDMLDACEKVWYGVTHNLNASAFNVHTKRFTAACERGIEGKSSVFAYTAYRGIQATHQVESLLYLVICPVTEDDFKQYEDAVTDELPMKIDAAPALTLEEKMRIVSQPMQWGADPNDGATACETTPEEVEEQSDDEESTDVLAE